MMYLLFHSNVIMPRLKTFNDIIFFLRVQLCWVSLQLSKAYSILNASVIRIKDAFDNIDSCQDT